MKALRLKFALVGLFSLALAAPAGAQACKNDGKQPSQLTVSKAQGSIQCLINKRRRAHGLSKLHGDRRLKHAAQKHSNSMDAHDYFAHNSPRGSTPQSRIQRTGYLSGASSWGVGENIAWGGAGRGSAKATVAAWMRSPEHRAAILSRRYRQLGVGVALGSPTGGGEGNAALYTTDFGYRH
jgi:uncharacterized protein YkwD